MEPDCSNATLGKVGSVVQHVFNVKVQDKFICQKNHKEKSFIVYTFVFADIEAMMGLAKKRRRTFKLHKEYVDGLAT